MISLVGRVLAAAPTGGSSGRTLLTYIHDGGKIGYVIIGLSFAAVVLVVAQLIRLRLSRLAPEEHVARIDESLRSGQLEQAIVYCNARENDSFITRVMGAAMTRCSRSAFGLLELRAAIEEAGQQEVARLHRATDSVGLIASIAPMLGLLGTVVGMVGAFDTLHSSEGFPKPADLAGDISVALITTVLGLIVAIPATAAYSHLRNRVDALTNDVGSVIEELIANVEGVAPGASEQKPAKPAPRARAGATGAKGT